MSARSAGAKVRGSILHGSLAEERPDLARQWDLESNGSHTPSTVPAGSTYRASWRCERGCVHCGLPHEWVAAVAQRSQKGSGCPFCSGRNVCKCQSLAAKHSQLMKQWDWEGNQGTDPYSVGCYSTKKVLWTCSEHGQWDATPKSRLKNTIGCPECVRQHSLQPRVRRGLVKDELPDIYAELHPSKNDGVDTEILTCGSHRKVWWLCQSNKSRPEGCEHEHAWETSVRHRCDKQHVRGCPFCAGNRVCPCNSFAALHPALLLYWDSGNANPSGERFNPFELGAHSDRKVRWCHTCADELVHHWWAIVKSVVRRFEAQGRVPCPGCATAIRTAVFTERRAALIRRK